ncbi:hexapeptide transferase [Terrimesophilobacter mesophilus]|uniref:Hexapeptide transferase n=1 Tax=Terrimesophilobacter mesophilus TaxID=433647 RepID=A0A4R8VER5_9MICO|nr:sugar-transfer associated ATP-grasp domain-containing protein [Terrimesophilobacter mesophilus]TFB80672.1 hexapeptide transferase [Terrimesophilobacter mesophilus]
MWRRIKYFFWRASNVDTTNLFRIARKLSASSGKPMLWIAADMIWSAAAHETGFTDYQDWDFHLLKHRERITYMTHPKSNHIAQLVNQKPFRHFFADKSEFVQKFAAYTGRESLDVRAATSAELESFVRRHGSVIVKVTDSDGGQGIERREAADIPDFDAFRSELLAHRQFLVEQIIPQHPAMTALNPSSVNSLRIITYFDGTEVHVLARVLKMGNGGVIDNFAHGGMYTMLDESGVALHAAFDIEGDAYEIHPLSGIRIPGFQVPLYREVLALVDEVARIVPEIPYVGWDIAISPDRPVVIEGNYNTGVFQAKPSLTGTRTGLLPLYSEVIGF